MHDYLELNGVRIRLIISCTIFEAVLRDGFAT